MKYFFITVFVLLCIFWISTHYKEEFFQDFCASQSDCKTCANTSGCSWCPAGKRCLSSNLLKSTDVKCNQMNTISSAFLCDSPIASAYSIEDNPESVLYKDQIADRVRPPNVYMNDDMEYSPETVMSNVTNLRNDLHMYQNQLPDIVAASVENNIRPMVSGILSDNYYIQA